LLIVGLVTAYNKFEWFRDGINLIVNTVVGFFAGMVNAAIGAVNAIISAYNSIPLLPDLPKAPTVPVPQLGKTSNTPAPGRMSIPRLADGGIVSSPTLALNINCNISLLGLVTVSLTKFISISIYDALHLRLQNYIIYDKYRTN
jgi:hypothetical protein